jgi:hypothetical protein
MGQLLVSECLSANCFRFKRSELATTLTELKAMAKAARIG